jgi:hypothetical protein
MSRSQSDIQMLIKIRTARFLEETRSKLDATTAHPSSPCAGRVSWIRVKTRVAIANVVSFSSSMSWAICPSTSAVGIIPPTLEQAQSSCWLIRAAGSLKSGPALTPGSDPESASSFLRGASSWRSGHPVCGPWRSVAGNWRWPCPPRRTQEARTPGRPVRSQLCHAKFPVRLDSTLFATCRATPAYAPIMSYPMQSPAAMPFC